MAAAVNKVILIGNVGTDPDIRMFSEESRMASFSLATTETWRDRLTKERRERTEWHRIVVFNENLVRIVEQYVRKGTRLYLEGQLQTRKWQAQDGSERFTTEIVLPRFRGELQMLGGRDTQSVNEYGASWDRDHGGNMSDASADSPFGGSEGYKRSPSPFAASRPADHAFSEPSQTFEEENFTKTPPKSRSKKPVSKPNKMDDGNYDDIDSIPF